jgi:hypothetical protein
LFPKSLWFDTRLPRITTSRQPALGFAHLSCQQKSWTQRSSITISLTPWKAYSILLLQRERASFASLWANSPPVLRGHQRRDCPNYWFTLLDRRLCFNLQCFIGYYMKAKGSIVELYEFGRIAFGRNWHLCYYNWSICSLKNECSNLKPKIQEEFLFKRVCFCVICSIYNMKTFLYVWYILQLPYLNSIRNPT